MFTDHVGCLSPLLIGTRVGTRPRVDCFVLRLVDANERRVDTIFILAKNEVRQTAVFMLHETQPW